MSDQLRAACIHGRYEAHGREVKKVRGRRTVIVDSGRYCPGGRHLTVGEVIEWIGEQDADLLERET